MTLAVAAGQDDRHSCRAIAKSQHNRGEIARMLTYPKPSQSILFLISLAVLGLASGGLAPLAIAQSHFGDFAVGTGQPTGKLRGTTGGKTSLPAIVSNRDRHNNQCLGYADSKPDHLLILKESLPNLRLQLKSGKVDTTLVVQGPDGVVRCGDDTGTQKAASIVDTDWGPGTYKVWVGTTTPGEQVDYVLTVQP